MSNYFFSVCKNHRWQCQTNDCPATCSAYGDSHYTTFDGRKYEFQGSCDYIMAKSTAENPDKFLITTTNLQCGTSGVACSKGIEFISGDERTSSFYRLQFVRGKTKFYVFINLHLKKGMMEIY